MASSADATFVTLSCLHKESPGVPLPFHTRGPWECAILGGYVFLFLKLTPGSLEGQQGQSGAPRLGLAFPGSRPSPALVVLSESVWLKEQVRSVPP